MKYLKKNNIKENVGTGLDAINGMTDAEFNDFLNSNEKRTDKKNKGKVSPVYANQSSNFLENSKKFNEDKKKQKSIYYDDEMIDDIKDTLFKLDNDETQEYLDELPSSVELFKDTPIRVKKSKEMDKWINDFDHVFGVKNFDDYLKKNKDTDKNITFVTPGGDKIKSDDERYEELWQKYMDKRDEEEMEMDDAVTYRSDSITKDFKDMSLMEKFIDMTKWTYILGQEDELAYIFPSDIIKDPIGNYYMKIGQSDTMFTCHLDTATSKKVKVNHLFENEDDEAKQTFISTDGRTILGADDKAGVLIMLNMIENKVPGLYYFFIGEEKGTVGSNGILEADPKFFESYKKCIAFDRRGYGSIITKQYGSSCCSPEFAEALVKEMAKATGTTFKEDPTGVYTDSAVFMDIIPEVTNISVGYFNEHSGQEFQNMTYLEWLCAAVIEVNWESLPIKRDPMEYYNNLVKTKKSSGNKNTENSDYDDNYSKLFNIVEEIMADVSNMECLNGEGFQPEKEMIFEDWNDESNVSVVIIHSDYAITIGKDYFTDLDDLATSMKDYYNYDVSRIEDFYNDEEDEEDEDDDYLNYMSKKQKELSDALDDDEDEELFETGISLNYFMQDIKTDLLNGKKVGHISSYNINLLLEDYGKSIESLVTWIFHNGNDPRRTFGLTWDADENDFYFEEVK